MANYRVYSLDGSGRIGFPVDFDADGDRQAIERVREMRPFPLRCEIWTEQRMVAALRGQECDA
jgi:hypothetical protein